MLEKIKNTLVTVINFVTISFWSITFFILLLFWLQTPHAEYVTGFVYSFSILLYYYFLLLILSLILSPFFRAKYLKYLIIVPKVVIDSFLLADYFVFKIYRFHIDLLFLKMMIQDFKGIGLSPLLVIISLLAFLLVVALNFWLFKWSMKHRLLKLKPLLITMGLFFLSGQLIHIWANDYKQRFIQQYTPYFPYYFPTTSSHLMAKIKHKYAFLVPDPLEKPAADFKSLTNSPKTQNLFKFPLHAPTYKDTLEKRPNIMIIALESWRSDFLNPSATPFLDSLAQENLNFKHHFSSGNVTVSGIFGMLYGLHAVYLPFVQAKVMDYPALLTQALHHRHYKLGVYTASNLDRFSIKAMMFPRIKSPNYVNYMGERADKNDAKVTTRLMQDLQQNDTLPWFKFFFLTASHHHYFYPAEYNIFKPVPENSEGFIFNRNADPLPYINDYKNALRYEDDLVRKVIKVLKQTGQYNHTLIFITGDHGEEFNDNRQAYWGHGSNYTRYQTQVPLIVHLPYQPVKGVVKRMTGHIDLVPTILKHYLGLLNPLSDYTSGQDFLDTVPHKGLILTSYKDKAYIIGNKVYQTGLFVKSYHINDITIENKQYNYKAITDLRQEETRFLKKP